MTELELFIDFYKNTPRQGPGSNEETLKALEFTGLSNKSELRIADIGCGSGAQTIILAKNLKGHITAVDLFPQFLVELNASAASKGLSKHITTLEASMEDLPFEEDSFDLIWSEGAVYNMGFENGIKNWKKYLKIGGYIAISEITWTTTKRPKPLEDFWLEEYPEIATAATKIAQLEKNGLELVGYFNLAAASWLNNYYQPLETKFETFLNRHNYSNAAINVINGQKAEIALYEKYKDYYSYGFYIARKGQLT
jgi:ubiquinone/menaquinone biosynthesis C-methylase UbiE